MADMFREAGAYARYQGEGPDDWPDDDADAPCPTCGDEGWIYDDSYQPMAPDEAPPMIPCPKCNPLGDPA